MSKKLTPLTVPVAITISREIDECFDYIVPVPLEKIFKRTFFLPGVKRTDEESKWITPGMTRTIYFTDGTKAKETLEHVNSPNSFSYKVQNFTGINKFLIDHIGGEWTFSETAHSTQIEWQYALHPKSKLAALAIKTITPVIRRMLTKALKSIKENLEK